MAEVGNRLVPRFTDFMNTLGIAQYRVGAYADALATLTRCQELRASPDAGDLAFMAMANFKLGRADQARDQLDQLRALMKEPSRSGNAELQGFLREAEALIVRR
jgi:Flp pilus assembly protein TadD